MTTPCWLPGAFPRFSRMASNRHLWNCRIRASELRGASWTRGVASVGVGDGGCDDAGELVGDIDVEGAADV